MISVKGLATVSPSQHMAAHGEHTHHIKIRSTQMEMSSAGSSSRDEDYDRKLKDAQDELDRIQLQREELERKKSELEELTSRKRRTWNSAGSASPRTSTRSRNSIPRAGAATNFPRSWKKPR